MYTGKRRGHRRPLGNIITFNTKGLSFVVTSMFLVIFLNNGSMRKTLYGIDWSFLKHCLSLFLRQQFFHYPVHGAHAGHHYFIQETYWKSRRPLMTSLPFYEQVLIIAICAGATILTRLLLPHLQTRKPSSRLCQFSGKGPFFCSLCTSCHLLPERCPVDWRKLRHSWNCRTRRDHGRSSMERTDALIHGCRYIMLHGTRPVCFHLTP